MKKSLEVLAALLLVGGIASVRLFYITHPRFQTMPADMATARAFYPGRWPKPAATETSLQFENHASDAKVRKQWDQEHRVMLLQDRGAPKGTIDELIADLRKGKEPAGTVTDCRLANGLPVKTFTLEKATWFVFQGTNGHFYSASWDTPEDWVIRHRYEHYFRTILDSIQFKK
jgi:hypothetical protein